MLSMCVRETPHVAGYLQETFVSIAVPQHRQARTLLAFWDDRPEDGLLIGRDIPSHALASSLSHLIVWQPVAGGEDFVVRVIGENLRTRCDGFGVGKRMSELLSPELYAYHLHTDRRVLAEDRCDLLDVVHSHNGSEYLHYEMVLFSARSQASGERWIVVGVFYF